MGVQGGFFEHDPANYPQIFTRASANFYNTGELL